MTTAAAATTAVVTPTTAVPGPPPAATTEPAATVTTAAVEAVVPLTPAQQAVVDALIGKRLAESTRKSDAAWTVKLADAAALAGKSETEAATYRAEQAEAKLATTGTENAANLTQLHARFAALAAGVTEAVMPDVLALAGPELTACTVDGVVDTAKVTAAIAAVLTRLPQLATPATSTTATATSAATRSGGDGAGTANEHIYTTAEVNALTPKHLTDNPDVMAAIESQLARGLIK